MLLHLHLSMGLSCHQLIADADMILVFKASCTDLSREDEMRK